MRWRISSYSYTAIPTREKARTTPAPSHHRRDGQRWDAMAAYFSTCCGCLRTRLLLLSRFFHFHLLHYHKPHLGVIFYPDLLQSNSRICNCTSFTDSNMPASVASNEDVEVGTADTQPSLVTKLTGCTDREQHYGH